MHNLLDTFRKSVITHLGDRSRNWLAKEAGINQGSLNQFLNGEGNPSLKTVEAISTALNVSPAILLGGADGKSYDIPQDILEMLDSQSPAVFDSIRTILKTIASEKEKPQKKRHPV